MDGMMLPILIAGVVILLVFSLWQIAQSLMDPEKRKLKQRLSDGPRAAAASNLNVSITMQNEATGLSAKLASLGPLKGVYRQILQAWPDLSLATFLLMWAGLAIVLFTAAFAISGALIVGIVAAAMGAYIPFVMLGRKRATRQRLIATQLPDGLDFLSRILKAGHSLSTGLQMM